MHTLQSRGMDGKILGGGVMAGWSCHCVKGGMVTVVFLAR